MQWKLADLFVQFVAKGMGDIGAAMGVVRSDLDRTGEAAKAVGKSASDGLNKASQAAGVFSQATAKSFNAGSVQAQILSENVDKVKLALFGAQSAAMGLGGETVGQMVAASAQAKLLSDHLRMMGSSGKVVKDSFGQSLLGFFTEGQKATTTWRQSLDKWGKTAAWAFGSASAALGGFITAGIRGSAVGEMLSFRMGELSRSVAGLFQPELQKLTETIGSVVNWFRSLTDAQRDNIVWWVKFGGSLLLVVAIAPKVVSAIGAIVTMTKNLGVSIAFVTGMQGGYVKIAAGLSLAAAAAYGLNKLTNAMTPDTSSGSGGGNRRELMPGSGPVTSVTDTWKKIQEASYGSAGKTTEQRLLAQAEEQTKIQSSIVAALLAGLQLAKPAVV